MTNTSDNSPFYHISAFPKRAYVGRIIAKENFYDKTNYATKLLFQNEIARITWEYKLSPETINLAAKSWPEAEVFRIELKNHEIPLQVLKTIDSNIPYPILFTITKGDVEKAIIGYKEQTAMNENIAKVDTFFETGWNDSRLSEIKIKGLDIDTVYSNFIRQVTGDRLAGNGSDASSNANASDYTDTCDNGIDSVVNDKGRVLREPQQDNNSDITTTSNVLNETSAKSKSPSIKTELEQMKSREKLAKQIADLDRRIKSEPSIGKKQKLARERWKLAQELK